MGWPAVFSRLFLRLGNELRAGRRARWFAAGPVITPIFDCFEARFSPSERYGRPSKGRGLSSNQRFNKSPKGPNPPEPDYPVTAVGDRD